MSVAVNDERVKGPHSASFFTSTFNPPSKPTAVILFLHGFCDYFGRYSAALKLIAEKGIAVVAFDQRGWGKTVLDKENGKGKSFYGQTTTALQLEDIDFMLTWTFDKFSVPVFLMGHSMGGQLSLAYPTRGGSSLQNVPKLSGVISLSPLVQQTTPSPKWQRSLAGVALKIKIGPLQWLKIPSAVEPQYLSRDAKVGEEYMKDPLVILHGTMKGISDMLNLADSLHKSDYKNWPPNLPLFIAHGDADTVASHETSAQFFKDVYAKDKSISTFPGAYHELLHESDGVMEKLVGEIVDWVDAHSSKVTVVSHTTPSPSAAVVPAPQVDASDDAGATTSKL